jgi:hypothetical protein
VISFEDGDVLDASNFFIVYGKNPDLLTPGSHITGDDAVAIALAATGAIVDVYGVIGTDGTNQMWDYADSYSYRKPGLAIGPTNTFNDDQWIFGGASLWNVATTAADIVAATTPGWHTCLAIPDIQGRCVGCCCCSSCCCVATVCILQRFPFLMSPALNLSLMAASFFPFFGLSPVPKHGT